MTDSLIQFNYADSNHLASVYIRSDTYHEDFIPKLEQICAEIDHADRFQKGRLNWENFCLEIIKKLCVLVDSPNCIKITSETSDTSCNTIYKHTIEPITEKYQDFTIQTSKTLNITSILPISTELIFNGNLFEFVVDLKREKHETEGII